MWFANSGQQFACIDPPNVARPIDPDPVLLASRKHNRCTVIKGNGPQVLQRHTVHERNGLLCLRRIPPSAKYRELGSVVRETNRLDADS